MKKIRDQENKKPFDGKTLLVSSISLGIDWICLPYAQLKNYKALTFERFLKKGEGRFIIERLAKNFPFAGPDDLKKNKKKIIKVVLERDLEMPKDLSKKESREYFLRTDLYLRKMQKNPGPENLAIIKILEQILSDDGKEDLRKILLDDEDKYLYEMISNKDVK